MNTLTIKIAETRASQATVAVQYKACLLQHVVQGENRPKFCSTGLLRPSLEIKRIFFHFKTSYSKTDASGFSFIDFKSKVSNLYLHIAFKTIYVETGHMMYKLKNPND